MRTRSLKDNSFTRVSESITNIVTKSHIRAANAPVNIDVPKEHLEIANESKACLKRALQVMENAEDHEPKSVLECKNRNDWPKRKDEIEAKLKFLEKRDVFRLKSDNIIVQTVRSSDNLTDLFTKALPTATFKKLIHDIRMRRLNELK
ncbi:hypothetical protein Tco_0252418 [Tanacetum coccineum]